MKVVQVRPKEAKDVVYLDEVPLNGGFYVINVGDNHMKLPFLILRWYGKGKAFSDFNMVWEWLLVPHFNNINSHTFQQPKDAITWALNKKYEVMMFKDEREFELYLIEYCKSIKS